MFDRDNYVNNIMPFYGVVEDTIDECYVKVRVFGTHPQDKTLVTTEMLPNMLVLYPTGGGQVDSGMLNHNIPVDAWVRGEWIDWPMCQQGVVTHVVQGTDYSMSNYGSGGGAFVGQGGEYLDDGNYPEVDTSSSMNIPGGSTIEKTYNYVYAKLTNEGGSNDPHMHTCALIGVLMLETTNINPTVVGGYKGRAWGICQWLGPRRRQLFRKYGRTKRLDHQLDFMWWELNNTERRAKGLWLRGTNLPDAVEGFCMFERAEEVIRGRVRRGHPNYKKRLQFAYQAYNSLKKSESVSVSENTNENTSENTSGSESS